MGNGTPLAPWRAVGTCGQKGDGDSLYWYKDTGFDASLGVEETTLCHSITLYISIYLKTNSYLFHHQPLRQNEVLRYRHLRRCRLGLHHLRGVRLQRGLRRALRPVLVSFLTTSSST